MWVSVATCNNRKRQHSMLHVPCIFKIFLIEPTHSTLSGKMYPIFSDIFRFLWNHYEGVANNVIRTVRATCSTFHSFHWHVQNATIPSHSQELLPFLSVMYFFLPPFSTNFSSILSQLILPSISWSTSQSCCSQIRI